MDIVKFVRSYVTELENIVEKKLTLMASNASWVPPPKDIVKINFDVVFDTGGFRSGTGIVIKGMHVGILASRTLIHSNVGSPFVAEALACS